MWCLTQCSIDHQYTLARAVFQDRWSIPVISHCNGRMANFDPRGRLHSMTHISECKYFQSDKYEGKISIKPEPHVPSFWHRLWYEFELKPCLSLVMKQLRRSRLSYLIACLMVDARGHPPQWILVHNFLAETFTA